MKVLKFGGTSVANSKNITKVIEIIEKAAQKETIVVVVSAFGKTTNHLIDAAHKAANQNKNYTSIFNKIAILHTSIIKELIVSEHQNTVIKNVSTLFKQLETLYNGCFSLQEITPKSLDAISSFGELLSSYIISEIAKQTIDATYKDSRELIMAFKSTPRTEVNFKLTQEKCDAYFSKNTHRVTILPGFIAGTKEQQAITLGRGGSDFSAAIYASVLDANELQIWTDVSGMFTANPSVVKGAFPIPHISYQEAMELSHFGAKVLYPPTILPVLKKEIPIVIKNTFKPEKSGTLITKTTQNSQPVRGISHIENISLLTIEGSGLIGLSHFSKRLFETLSNQLIHIVLITQASSEHSICLGVFDVDAQRAAKSINEIFAYEMSQRKIKPTVVEKNLSIIALVGDKMKNHQGLSGQMFSALGNNNINIRAIAQGASEKNISAVINSTDARKALNILHEQFFEEKTKQLHLFITGVGNVGEQLITQIHQQTNYLKDHLKLQIKIIGISNSKKLFFDENGIDATLWKTQLENGEKTSLETFFKKVISLNLRNSIFIDNTANQFVSEVYEKYLRHKIAVITCNKIACASTLNNYKTLQRTAKEYNVSFLYETNVGAGLPIIDTLKNLITSGDRIHKIQAVLSGSLNFVFNNFDENTTFKEVVLQAQKEGYTEPDPTIDLSGIDVARKILILARETGAELELSDIKKEPFLPEKSLKTTNNDDFYATLHEFESHFQKIYQEANAKNCKLKYVAAFENGKAKVGLQHIPENHPFYNLAGSDNIVLFFTDRYPVNPLVIKGSGAGAAVTASGIFADVIRVRNQ